MRTSSSKVGADGLTASQRSRARKAGAQVRVVTLVCKECGKMFQHRSFLKRLFCSNLCARRKSARRWQFKNLYKITLEDYDRILKEQDGCCALCRRSSPRKLEVDHCHDSGRVRGLLCGQCNTGLGLLGDQGEFLAKAVAYLGYPNGTGILSASTLRRLKPVEPFIERTVIGGLSAGVSVAGYDVRIREKVTLKPGDFSLASTVEKFALPNNVMAWMKDKSSWARRGLSVFNTCLEPGWKGTLTLELKNLGHETLIIESGSPIAQAVFAFTDEPTEGYSGKYQNQEAGPQTSRHEN